METRPGAISFIASSIVATETDDIVGSKCNSIVPHNICPTAIVQIVLDGIECCTVIQINCNRSIFNRFKRQRRFCHQRSELCPCVNHRNRLAVIIDSSINDFDKLAVNNLISSYVAVGGREFAKNTVDCHILSPSINNSGFPVLGSYRRCTGRDKVRVCCIKIIGGG